MKPFKKQKSLRVKNHLQKSGKFFEKSLWSEKCIMPKIVWSGKRFGFVGQFYDGLRFLSIFLAGKCNDNNWGLEIKNLIKFWKGFNKKNYEMLI